MSSRQLRKLRQQQELLKKQDEPSDTRDESEEEDEHVSPVKPRVSMFAALGGDDDDEEDEQEEDEHAEDTQPVNQVESEPEKEIATASKKKKKPKKKKKGKKTADKPLPTTNDPDEDEIDRAMKELNINIQKQPSHSTGQPEVSPGSGAQRNEILSVNPYNLRAVHEMKNLFGREVIEAARLEEEAQQQAAHRQLLQGGQRQVDLETFLKGDPRLKLPEVTLRRNVFIQGKDYWPRASAGGLVMKEIGKDAGGEWTEYAFCHEKQYDAVQMIFFQSVGIGDPMRMVYLLKQFPYHVSTLLQVSSFAKQDQNQALSADLLERALFTFGRATTASFRDNLEKGRARLDFRRPENRQFWLAGYHYIKGLMRKGTYRTGLEWAKLLFGLDPENDPYGMNHLIHVLAVRARETDWLEKFLGMLSEGHMRGEQRYYGNSLVLGLIQQQREEEAKEMLVTEMERTPWLYCALFQALNLDAPPSIWGRQPGNESDAFYTTLYVEMTKELWNYPRCTSLLQVAAAAAKKVPEADVEQTTDTMGLRTARFVYLEGNTKLLGLIPKHLFDRQPNYEFDPMPPDRANNIFSAEGTRVPFDEARPGHGPALRVRWGAPRGPQQNAEEDELLQDFVAGLNDAGVEEGDVIDDEGRALEQEEGGEAPGHGQGGHDDSNEGHREGENSGESGQEGGGFLARLYDFMGRGSGEGLDGGSAAGPSGLPGSWPADERDEWSSADGDANPQAPR